MSISKPWYLSRTIFASVVTVVAALAGLSLPGGEAGASSLADSLLQVLTGLSGLLAIYGRVRARTRIG